MNSLFETDSGPLARPQALEVELNGLLDEAPHLRLCFADGNTARTIRHVGFEARLAPFDNDQVAHLANSSRAQQVAGFQRRSF